VADPRTDPRIAARNRLAFALQGILFFTGFAFFDTSTVLPLFIGTFSDRLALVGAAVALRQVSTLLVQLLFGPAVVRVRHVPRYLAGLLFGSYSAPLLVAAVLLAGVPGQGAIPVLFAALAIQWICDGFLVVGYYDLLGRTLEPRDRGRVLGLQQFVGGAGAVAGALLVKGILDRTAMPAEIRFAVVFLLGGGILFLGALSFGLARDVPHRRPQPEVHPLRHLREIPSVLRGNRPFALALLCQSLLTVAMAGAPYVLLMARDRLGLPDATVTLLLNIQVLGGVAGGVLMAVVAPRHGSRGAIRLFCLLVLAATLAGLSASAGGLPPLPALSVMALATGVGLASWTGFMAYFVDVAPPGRIPLHMACNSLVTLPLSVAALAGGFLVQLAGYTVLLALCAAFALPAAVLSFRLPRPEAVP